MDISEYLVQKSIRASLTPPDRRSCCAGKFGPEQTHAISPEGYRPRHHHHDQDRVHARAPGARPRLHRASCHAEKGLGDLHVPKCTDFLQSSHRLRGSRRVRGGVGVSHFWRGCCRIRSWRVPGHLQRPESSRRYLLSPPTQRERRRPEPRPHCAPQSQPANTPANPLQDIA